MKRHEEIEVKPLAVGVDDACRLLGGIDRTYLYRLSNAGKIRTFKVGRRRLVTVAEIERFIAEREEESRTRSSLEAALRSISRNAAAAFAAVDDADRG